MTADRNDNASLHPFEKSLTPISLLNLMVKAFGLYWFAYSAYRLVEAFYQKYAIPIRDLSVSSNGMDFAPLDIAMLLLGSWLVAYSTWISRLAYSFDVRPEALDDQAEQGDAPESDNGEPNDP